MGRGGGKGKEKVGMRKDGGREGGRVGEERKEKGRS